VSVTGADNEALAHGASQTLEDDDAPFVARCRQGEVNAFEKLVERHQKTMLNISFRMLGDYADACDVVQESFLAAYRSLERFRGDARFSTWLSAIVVNQSRNRLKQKASRARREVVSIDDTRGTGDRTILETHASPEPAAVDMLGKKERDLQIQKCIGVMDDEQREVLVLRDIEGMPYEEIGAVLGLPDGTVKSRLFRARNALKNCLKKAWGELS
jgi:RNA polymerase sigma-70 factor (ECF subfamily)